MRVIQEIGVKTLHLAENREASTWVKVPVGYNYIEREG